MARADFCRHSCRSNQLFAALGIAGVDVEQSNRDALHDAKGLLGARAGLAIIHCAADQTPIDANKLRDVDHVYRQELLDERGEVVRARLPRTNVVVLILVEDDPTAILAATKLSTALANDGSLVGSLVIAGHKSGDRRAAYDSEAGYDDRFDDLARKSDWLAFAGVDIYETFQAPDLETFSTRGYPMAMLRDGFPTRSGPCEAGEQVAERSILHRGAAGRCRLQMTALGDDAARARPRHTRGEQEFRLSGIPRATRTRCLSHRVGIARVRQKFALRPRMNSEQTSRSLKNCAQR